MGSGGVRNSQKSCVGRVSRLSSERNRNMHCKIKNLNSSEPPVHCTVLHWGKCIPENSSWCVCLIVSIFPIAERQILLLCFHSCYSLGMFLHFPVLIWLMRLHRGLAETSGGWLCTWILAARHVLLPSVGTGHVTPGAVLFLSDKDSLLCAK